MSDIDAKGPIYMDISRDGILNIDLFGSKFRLKPDDNGEEPEQLLPEHIIDELNRYVEGAQQSIKFTASDKNKLAILLIASMNMSIDLRKIRLQYEQLYEQVINKTSTLLNKLEQELEVKE